MARIGELIGPNGEVIQPKTSAEVVYLEDGRTVEQVLSDDVDYGNMVFQDNTYHFGNDVEDDFAKTVIIKGQTYQNILPEPSTPILSNNKKMFKVNEGLDANVNIVDGIAKYAVLSGQTLVNLVQQNNMYLLFGTSGQGRVNRTITTSGAIYETSVDNLNSYITVRTGAHTLLKPNTSYTIFFEVVQNTITKSGVDYKGVTVSGYNDSYYGRSGDRQLYHDGNFSLSKGLKKIVITTSSDVTSYDGLGFGFPSFNTNETPQGQVFEIQNVMVIEGDYSDQDIPYFTGMTNCKAPVLQTVGANLWSSCEKYTCESTNGQTIANDITKFSKIFIGKTIQNGLVFRAKVTKENLVQNTTYNSSYHFGLDICFYCSDGTTVWSDFTTSKLGSLADANGKTYTFFNSRLAGKTVVNVKHCSLFMRGLEGKFEMYDIEIFDCHENNVPAQYEAYKSNTVTTNNEVALRSSPNGVCDTLNLITGEYVQRIGEVVLNGSENWVVESKNSNVTSRFSLKVNDMLNENIHTVNDNNLNVSGVFPVLFRGLDDQEQIFSHNGAIHIRINDSKLNDANDTNSFKAYLQSNPITVQYKLATPIIKTVDLSSSRNWMELTLTGEEEWRDSGNTPYITPSVQPKKGLIPFSNGEFVGVDIAESFACFWLGGGTNTPNGNLVFYHPMVKNAIQMKEFLRNNPQKIYYYVEDGMGCIKQPIFFKDGHIIQSSGANNSLIPTLDYQAKTSNSYVIDLIKDGHTTYTIKADSASGSLIFSNGSVTLTGNNKFTTPNKYDHKFAILDGSWSNPMIIEGDQTDKDIPYFTGIKSSFENDHPLEMVSESANKWKGKTQYLPNEKTTFLTHEDNECVFEHKCVNQGIRINITEFQYQTITLSYDIEILDGVALNIGGHNRHQGIATYIDGVKVNCSYHNGYVMSYEKNRKYHIDAVFNINLPVHEGLVGDREYIGIEPNRYSNDNPTYCKMRVTNFQITLGETPKKYVEPKISHTKIPLLSPLRSLPNGVCDEIVIDRVDMKATLIQRVGHDVINREFSKNADKWVNTRDEDPCWGFHCGNYVQGADTHFHEVNTMNDTLYIAGMTTKRNPMMGFYKTNPHIALWKKEVCTVDMALNWLDRNPIDFYYELAKPVVTEIDLEVFPYIYKDGHVFINSEIAPTVGIEYSINQAHRIEGQVETLQRHEKQFTQLERYFADLIYSDYNFALLRFNEGLR